MSAIKEILRSIRLNGIKETVNIYGKFALGIADYQEEIDTLFYFLNEYVDITKVPPATGNLREVQLSDTVLLKVFDKFCEKNKLIYWLNYGTLLGGVRHKGFIPWDDDLDLAMPRQDYEKTKVIFKEFAKENGFRFYVNAVPDFESIGIGYKDAGLWLDIFPIDIFTYGANEESARKCCMDNLEKYQSKALSGKQRDWDYLRSIQMEIVERGGG